MLDDSDDNDDDYADDDDDADGYAHRCSVAMSVSASLWMHAH